MESSCHWRNTRVTGKIQQKQAKYSQIRLHARTNLEVMAKIVAGYNRVSYMNIPGARKKSWWKKKWFRELVYNGPPIIAALIAAIKATEDIQASRIVTLAALGIFLWLLIAMGMRIAIAREEDTKDSPDVVHEGLYAAVSTFHTMLWQYCQTRECGGNIRATFHRVVPPLDDPKEIEQIINYVGDDSGGAGRTFPVNAGITGQAIRNKTAYDMSNETGTDEALRNELIRYWGYTQAQARRLTPGRYSAVAVPVLDRSGQHAVGVLYLDSTDRTLFFNKEVMEIVGVGSQAISEFVTKRY